jgi:aspartate carbamoyltransferase catalytic subunit
LHSSFQDRDIISINDLTREEILYILEITDTMEPLLRRGSEILRGKLLISLFYEASTRTRLSFESAMYRLGGDVLGFAESRTSSVQKGENLADTIRVVENYGDIIILRHPMEGAARLAAEFSSIPVVNAGSGAEEHPTQALLDLYTIQKELGRIDEVKIGMVGDLRYGRTVHSLAYGLANFDVELHLIAPESLKMRREVLEQIKDRITIKETKRIQDILSELDVLYVTRLQKERYVDPNEYEKVKGAYKITEESLRSAKDSLIIMHPLPRIDEISSDVDLTRHAKYFKQTQYGVFTRMALLSLIFNAIN